MKNKTTTDGPLPPDEKAQIVIHNVNAAALILRYGNVRRAEAEYAKIQKAWEKQFTTGEICTLPIKSDMFNSTIDLGRMAHVSLVIHSVRNAFEPIRE